jgi:hypothetical protein
MPVAPVVVEAAFVPAEPLGAAGVLLALLPLAPLGATAPEPEVPVAAGDVAPSAAAPSVAVPELEQPPQSHAAVKIAESVRLTLVWSFISFHLATSRVSIALSKNGAASAAAP